MSIFDIGNTNDIKMLIDTKYKSLEENQVQELKFLLSQRGNGAALVRKTGLSIITIKRAAEGKNLTDHVYKTITTTLKKVMP